VFVYGKEEHQTLGVNVNNDEMVNYLTQAFYHIKKPKISYSVGDDIPTNLTKPRLSSILDEELFLPEI
jgi:hypothetical protein